MVLFSISGLQNIKAKVKVEYIKRFEKKYNYLLKTSSTNSFKSHARLSDFFRKKFTSTPF